MADRETPQVATGQLLSLLGGQYKHLFKIAEETFRSLGKEQAGYFINLSNDWIDVLSAILDTYSKDALSESLMYIYFSGLFKEVHWFQLFFLTGNYPLLQRSLRFVWEMIFRAYYVDTYKHEFTGDQEPPGPTIDDKVDWLGKYELKLKMYKWSFMRKVLRRLCCQVKDTRIEGHYRSLWGKLNEYVHPSKALLDRMVVGVPGSLMTDIFDEQWALETIKAAQETFDPVWLAVLSRFPKCAESLVQKRLLLEYPMVAAALRDLSKT
jgi:hypothetical protein